MSNLADSDFLPSAVISLPLAGILTSVFVIAGFAQRDERGRYYGQAGIAFSSSAQLVHSGHMCHLGRRALRGS